MAGKQERVIHGVPASPGIAIGNAFVCDEFKLSLEERTVPDNHLESEMVRLQKAIDLTREQILEIQKRVQEDLTEKEAKIFDAQILILDDNILLEDIRKNLFAEKKNIEIIFYRTVRKYISALSTMNNDYFRERASDIEDLCVRVLKNLSEGEPESIDHMPGQRIIVSQEMTPSDIAIIDRENTQAFITSSGSRTSHVAIMARSMEIPAVVGSGLKLQDIISNDDLVIVDGHTGTVVIHPGTETLKLYAKKEAGFEKQQSKFIESSAAVSETVDGFRLHLAANIESPSDIPAVERYNAQGIGLFRTEYLMMESGKIPNEEKQFNIYREVAAAMRGKPVVIRTFDIGGDKVPGNISMHHEANPFLGYRAVRLLSENPEIMRTQIRAILRAGAFGNIKIMFPMISNLSELLHLKEIIREVKNELKKKKIPYDQNIKTGIMVEVPSTAICAEHFAPEVDFFSIGTNDLVQYTLAVDRTNEKVADLYQPTHPAIINLMFNVVQAANKNGIWVGVCGEMASDIRYLPILVGMGIHELSMTPFSLGPVRSIVRCMKMHEAEEIANNARMCATPQKTLERSNEYLWKVAPEIVEMVSGGKE